jgi:RecA-family ATPase
MQTINYGEKLQLIKFDDTTQVKQDRIYFVIDENIIGTSGNFIALSGLAKSGKSLFISAILSSHISKRECLTFKLFSYPEKNKIALFDTEQSQFDFNRTVKRIKTFTGQEKIFKTFDAFMCNQESALDILRLIHSYLKSTENVGILIIDGILDCIDNFNDEGASKRLTRLLKKWASRYDCLIITVMHTSKQSGHTLGHYGSASDRYAQSTLNIEKSKEGTFICTPKYLRSAKDFEKIEIVYSEKLKTFVNV